MTRKTGDLLSLVLSKVWALEPTYHRRLCEIVARHVSGVRLTEEEIAAATAGGSKRERDFQVLEGGVAVIPITGIIARHSSQVNGSSQPQGTSCETIRAQVAKAVADDQVKALLLDVNSPGGSVDWIDETAQDIFAARQHKPVFGAADGMMCSAAYYLASQAQTVMATRTTDVGSIGVICSIDDWSRYDKNRGVDPIVVKSVPAKAGATRDGGVSDEFVEEMRKMCAAYHLMFLEAVARGRGISMEAAAQLGDGRVYMGKEALGLGLIDQIGTFEQVLEMARKAGAEHESRGQGRRTSAEAPDLAEPQALMGQEIAMDEKKIAPDALDRAVGERVAAMSAEDVRKQCPQAAAALVKAGAEAERARITVIRSLAETGQEELAERLITEGADETAALKALHADLRTRKVAALDSKRSDQKPLGAVAPEGSEDRFTEAEPLTAKGDAYVTKCKQNWESSAELRERYDSFDLYVAACRNKDAQARNAGRKEKR